MELSKSLEESKLYPDPLEVVVNLPFRTIVATLVTLMVSLALTAAVGAQPADRELQLPEQAEQKIERAVAYVAVEYQKPNSTRRYIESGSGFFVAPGYLITNHHVVAEALRGGTATIKVRVFSGTSQSAVFQAQIVKTDPQADLAILHVLGDLPAIEPVQLDPKVLPKQTPVFAFGFPLGTMLDRSQNGPNVCLRRGYVSRMINDGTNIEADMNIDKGISGGPLVDEFGIVRGVVRAMAGSDYNKAYAGISVTSALLVNFCSGAGCSITLSSGEVVEPGNQVSVPTPVGTEPDPRPRAGFAEEVLRGFFTIGSALRLSTLVPQMLAQERTSYSPGARQSSRGNADLILTGLRKLEAPAELVARAFELTSLISKPQSDPKLVSEKSSVLEQACDEWVREARNEEKLNYDLGAWLTELSLGVLDVKEDRDVKSCEYFMDQGKRLQASAEMMEVLGRMQTNLIAVQAKNTSDMRRVISRDADRLIGIGFLVTANRGLNPLPKPQTQSNPVAGGNNPIRVQQ